MKVSELRKQIVTHSPEQLQVLAVELYKVLSPSARKNVSLDALIKNPAYGKAKKQKNIRRSIHEIEDDTHRFVENARMQYYLVPNRHISKKERSTWRFIVMKLYKELITEKADQEKAAELLEILYTLLCEACDIILFTAYDVFESVGIAQAEFYEQVISAYEPILPKQEFITKAIRLMIDNGLNRYTLYSTIMETLLPLLRTPDMKTMASDQAHQMLLSHKKTSPLKYRDTSEYRRRGTVNVLCEFVFRCNMALSETKLALEYFDSHFEESNPEIKLYILVRLLMEYGKKDDILRAIREAKEKGIKPRSSLSALVQHIEQHNRLPQYLT